MVFPGHTHVLCYLFSATRSYWNYIIHLEGVKIYLKYIFMYIITDIERLNGHKFQHDHL